MDDYPNSSDTMQWAPEKPETRKEVEQKELTKVTTSIGAIQEILDWLDACIEYYARNDSLGVDESTPASDAKLAVLLAKGHKAEFARKAMSFRADFAKYLKEEQVDAAIAE